MEEAVSVTTTCSRRFAPAAAVCLAALIGLQVAPAQAESGFYVSAGSAGHIKEEAELGKLFDRFVSKVDARPDFSAARVEDRRPAEVAWLTPPEGVGADRWIRLMVVGFGSRRDWLAFAFDGPRGAASMALRRPASTRTPVSGYLHACPPGPRQVSHNAVAELAAEFAHFAGGASATREAGPVVSISLKSVVPDMDMPVPPVDAAETNGLMALAFAAAGAVGWQPVAGSEEPHLGLLVRRGPRWFSIDATLSSGTDKVTVSRPEIVEEGVYDGLVNLCRDLHFRDGDVGDDMQIEPAGFSLIGYHDRRLFLAKDNVLWCVDVTTGMKLWEVPKPERRSPLYSARTDEEGGLHVYEYDPGFEEVDLGSGRTQACAPTGVAQFPWGFAVDFGRRAAKPGMWTTAIVSERRLDFLDDGKAVWGITAGDQLGCGPRLTPEHVLVGGDAGEMLCLSRRDGKPVWRTQVDERLRGTIGIAGDRVLAGSVEGTVYAWDAGSGELVWRHELGDILVSAPEPIGGKILVAGRNNTVRLLDATTGRATATYETTSWLTGAAAAPDGSLVVCAQQNGEVAILGGSDLRPVRVHPLHATLRQGMLVCPSVPYRLRTAGQLDHDFVTSGPGVLVCDRRGFVYVIPVTP